MFVEGRVDVSGDVSLNSNVTISGDLNLNYVRLGGHIIPTANAQYDLGNAEYKIRHLFLSDNSLYMGPANENTAKKILTKNSRNEIEFEGDISSDIIVVKDISASGIGNFKTLTFGGDDTQSTLPSIRGTDGQVLQTDGSGTLSWVTSSAGSTINGNGFKSNTSNTNVNSNGGISLGAGAGSTTPGEDAIAIGYQAGQIDQSANSIAIGFEAGKTNLGEYSIAIGHKASEDASGNRNIVLNATDTSLNPIDSSACYIAPIRNVSGLAHVLKYNPTTKEVAYGSSLEPIYLIADLCNNITNQSSGQLYILHLEGTFDVSATPGVWDASGFVAPRDCLMNFQYSVFFRDLSAPQIGEPVLFMQVNRGSGWTHYRKVGFYDSGNDTRDISVTLNTLIDLKRNDAVRLAHVMWLSGGGTYSIHANNYTFFSAFSIN